MQQVNDENIMINMTFRKNLKTIVDLNVLKLLFNVFKSLFIFMCVHYYVFRMFMQYWYRMVRQIWTIYVALLLTKHTKYAISIFIIGNQIRGRLKINNT